MVRVISVHHFSKQDVSASPAPSAAALAGDSTLVLATHAQQLEVRMLSDTPAGKLSHAFQTVDRVSQLVYSPVGKYLATLEGAGGESAGVRVYVNWSDPAVDNAPIRPRIAAHTAPITAAESGETALDMIEFPQRDSPLRIAVCEGTGNLIVAAANLLIIYKFSVKTSKAGAKYMDFNECFHVFHNFVPREIALCEDVVGCLAENEVHVFKVKITQEAQPSHSGFSSLQLGEDRSFRSISVYSFTSESEPSSIATIDPWTGTRRGSVSNGSEDTESEREYGKVPEVKNVTLKRQQDSETGEFHLDGYGGNVKRHESHVFLNDPAPVNSARSPFHDVVIPEVEAANRELASMIGSPRIMEQTLGPTSPPSTRPTTIKYIGQGNGGDTNPRTGDFEADCVTLIHARLLPSEESHDGLKNLNLKPVYWREFRVRKSPATPAAGSGNAGGIRNTMAHPLQSPYHQHLMSLTTCFTSQNEGYLYHLPGHLRKQGKGCGVQRIATYPFTSPVGKVALEPTLLHALTETGLETYTLRSGYHTVLEAEKVNDRTNACPLNAENPICLVGLRPFLGAQHLMVSGSKLVILARNDAQASAAVGQKQLTKQPQVTSPDEDNSWTCYSLTMPTPVDLHKDMMALANMNKTISPQGYYQLLCEAHMVLRTSIHRMTWAHATKARVLTEEELSLAREKYRETCLFLAEYFVLAEEPEEWKMGLPYFRLSGKPIPEVVKSVKELWLKEQAKGKEDASSIPPGFLHYVREVILHPTKDEQGLLDASLADLVIDLLAQHSMATLGALVVRSTTFRAFKTKKIFEHFEKSEADECSPAEKAEIALAFAILAVEVNSTESVMMTLSKCSGLEVPLSELLIEHHYLLLETSTSTEGMMADSFSELALLVRNAMPDLFMEVLVSLIKGEVYSLSTVLALFIGSFVSVSNIVSEAATNAAMLQLFLETYFAEILEAANGEEDNNDSESAKVDLDPEQEQAAVTLARSYLTSLSVPVRFGTKDIDTDMFGARPAFLDKLPPFREDDLSAREALENVESPDFWCQNSLLKLQSLLSCPAMSGESCRKTVLSFLEMYPNVVGSLSLKVICSEPLKVISLICQEHPAVLLPYIRELQEEDRDSEASRQYWREVLNSLYELLNGNDDDEESSMHEAWYSAQQEVLDHLAQTLELDEFLQVLPTPCHSNEEFQGYIQMCRKNQQAADIQSLIVSTGHKLLSTLTL